MPSLASPLTSPAAPACDKAPSALALRGATPADAAAIAAIYAPIVSDTFISFETEPPSTEEMAARIRKTLARFPWLVALDEAGAVCGYAYASAFQERAAYRWSVGTSVYVRADCRRGGVARTLYGRLFDDLARLGYQQAMAGIALPNAASVGAHEAVGFRPVGVFQRAGHKLGQWVDVGWWQRELVTPSDAAPPEPQMPTAD